MKQCILCQKCHNEKHQVCVTCRKWYKKHKQRTELINLLGGKCFMCGNKNHNHLQFHHQNSSTKEFQIGNRLAKSYDYLVKEVKKCILLCANCHQEHHKVFKRNVLTYYKNITRIKTNKHIYKNGYRSYNCQCGRPKNIVSKLCKSCSSVEINKNISKRPTLIILKEDFKKLKYFTKVGKKYNVTANSVRKWCKFYNWNPKQTDSDSN